MRRIVIVNISVPGGNVPGCDHVAQGLERVLHFEIIRVSVSKSSITKRWTHVARDHTEDLLEGRLKTGHLSGDGFGRERSQLWMGPSVRCDLMARLEGTLENRLDRRTVDAVLVIAVHEEGHFEIFLVEQIKELVRVLRGRGQQQWGR